MGSGAQTGFMQEVGTDFIPAPWRNLEPSALSVGLASQILTGCDLQGQAPQLANGDRGPAPEISQAGSLP